MEQWDQYIIQEDGFTNLGIELKVNYYQYFDEKALFEVYFELQTPMGSSQQFQKLVCPSFFDKFITDDDYQHYFDSIYKWTGLKFVNTKIGQYDFLDLRSEALDEIKNDLYYESMYDRNPIEEAEFKNKWKINKIGESPYFLETIDITKSWGEYE